MKPSITKNKLHEAYEIDALESDYLYVQSSQIENSGRGLFTAIDILENEIISLFTGEVLTDKEAKKRALLKNDGYFISMLDGSILDSMHTECFAKYANDAEGTAKSAFKNNATITLDEDNKVCIKAIENISSGEEIFCGYGQAYWKKFAGVKN